MFLNLDTSRLGVSAHQNEAIEMALSYGYTTITIDIEAYAAQASARGPEYARRLLDSAKMAVGSFWIPISWKVEDEPFRAELEQLDGMAAMASDLGCRRVLVTVEPWDATRPYHENFEFHRVRFSDMAGVLERHDIALGIGLKAPLACRAGNELSFIQDVDALGQLIDLVGKSNVGYFVDAWEWSVIGASPEKIASLRGDQVVAVQIADLPAQVESDDAEALRQLTEHDRWIPGSTGKVSLLQWGEALQAIGFEGPVTPSAARAARSGVGRFAVARRAAEALRSALRGSEAYSAASSEP